MNWDSGDDEKLIFLWKISWKLIHVPTYMHMWVFGKQFLSNTDFIKNIFYQNFCYGFIVFFLNANRFVFGYCLHALKSKKKSFVHIEVNNGLGTVE